MWPSPATFWEAPASGAGEDGKEVGERRNSWGCIKTSRLSFRQALHADNKHREISPGGTAEKPLSWEPRDLIWVPATLSGPRQALFLGLLTYETVLPVTPSFGSLFFNKYITQMSNLVMGTELKRDNTFASRMLSSLINLSLKRAHADTHTHTLAVRVIIIWLLI